MPHWTPSPEWAGQDACIIGGGPSLVGFDFQRLAGRNVIGCNDAFRLGPEIVKICLFGDASWFHRSKWDVEKFQGRAVTCATSLYHLNCSWLLQLKRERSGLHAGHAVGWNFCTGCAAINLAITLGATRIFLLGFDLGKRGRQTHWHKYQLKNVEDSVYVRFKKGFENIAKDLPVKYPAVHVHNVTDGSSTLMCFPRLSFEVFWKYIPLQQRERCVPCEERKAAALAEGTR